MTFVEIQDIFAFRFGYMEAKTGLILYELKLRKQFKQLMMACKCI